MLSKLFDGELPDIPLVWLRPFPRDQRNQFTSSRPACQIAKEQLFWGKTWVWWCFDIPTDIEVWLGNLYWFDDALMMVWWWFDGWGSRFYAEICMKPGQKMCRLMTFWLDTALFLWSQDHTSGIMTSKTLVWVACANKKSGNCLAWKVSLLLVANL